MRPTYILVAVVALVVAGCSVDPAASQTVVRTVTVTATDAMAFDPSDFEIAAGETVGFEITNVGELQHEFFIGDAEAQEQHAAEMAEMAGSDMDHDEPTGVTIAPGETATLEYTFAKSGQLFAACHQPRHYEAGMVAELNVD